MLGADEVVYELFLGALLISKEKEGTNVVPTTYWKAEKQVRSRFSCVKMTTR